jgi:hypothetical protein
MKTSTACVTVVLSSALAIGASAQRGRGGAPGPQGTPTPPGPPRVEELKKEVAADIETMKVTTQQMVDQVFSFGELGFQEFETSKYLTAEHGRAVRRHRRRLVERADGDAQLSGEHPESAGAQLGQRDRHGDSDRA